jgi:hypothetical protein
VRGAGQREAQVKHLRNVDAHVHLEFLSEIAARPFLADVEQAGKR